ncbi:MAG: tRNA 2-selenouridine(34) synthase MnmH, partial [Mucinivorans sp.]
MRSESMAWLLDMAGIKVSVLIGGYKAYRTHFEELITNHPWRINLLGGSTGSAKTSILHALALRGEQVIDLEAIACHKGSVFGGFGQNQQPTTEHFFNLLHHEFCKLDPLQVVWCEGESMLIGHLFLPKFLFDLMYKGQYIEVYMNVEQRLDRLCIEYGHFSADLLIEAFSKIKKRIGTEQYNLALDAIIHGHIRTAATIALKYYDKAYMNSCITPDFRQEVDNDNIDSAIEQLINKV